MVTVSYGIGSTSAPFPKPLNPETAPHAPRRAGNLGPHCYGAETVGDAGARTLEGKVESGAVWREDGGAASEAVASTLH